MSLAEQSLLTLAEVAGKSATLTLLLIRSSSKVSRVAGMKSSKVPASEVTS
jgi:hypothetical protein